MDLLPEHESLESLTRGWWNGTMCRSTFLREPNRELRTLRQPGGVAIIANGKCSSHIVFQGNDAQKLGRWRWITLCSKEQHKMCVIGAYKTGASWITTLNQAVALQTETLGTNPCDIDPTVMKTNQHLVSHKANHLELTFSLSFGYT